ncbi:TonB-dependent receptor [Seongchinamella unica]|uniref:TonB-dependent receptor n=1 Tax=Seongchinamella unica TaxID=2547392 RepID=A0A4R5LTL5_9GAMM|nr:TonB-dependent receptor [Seongchinamella unica]
MESARVSTFNRPLIRPILQKREETNQEIPISITALSESALDKRGIRNSGDLIGEVAGMGGFEAPGAKGTTVLSMRGMAGGSPANLSLDPAVTIYLDGIFLGKQVGAATDVAEIERVEVLRGPQGTLYGRNSTGGAVNFISRKPSGEFGVRATGGIGNYSQRDLKLNVDLPTIGEVGEGLGSLAAAVGYQTRKRDHLYDNDSPGQEDFNDRDREAYRLSLKWDISDSFFVDYTYDHSELDEANALEQVVGFTPVDAAGMVPRIAALQGVLAGAQFWASQPGTDPRIGSRWIPSIQQTIADYQAAETRGSGRRDEGHSDHAPYTNTELKGHALTLTWDVGDITFKSITGYRETESYVFGDLEDIDSRLDADGIGSYNDLVHLTLGQLYGATGGFDPGIPQLPFDAIWDSIDNIGAFHSKQDTTSEYEQLSQELQMVGSTDSVEYVLGLFYFEDDGEYRRDAIFAAPLAGTAAQYYDNSTEAIAAYGQATWRPGWMEERFAFTLGLRYTEEDKDIDYDYPPYFSPFAGNVPGQAISLEESFDNVSGNFTVAYQATDDINAFLRYSTGYRSGGFNGEIFNNPYDDEEVEQWEIGIKSDWWDGRMRINASLYTYIWEDIQTTTIDTSGGSASTKVVNAGEADRWGGEVEFLVAPIEDLILSLSYAHIDGDFEEYPDVCGLNDFADTCLSGEKYAKRGSSPDNQVSFSADYVFARTALGEWTGYLQVNWQDEWFESPMWNAVVSDQPVVYPHQIMDERTLVSARLSLEEIELGDGRMRFTLWGDNLTDEDYPVYSINFGSLGPITEQYGDPRTYGLEVSYEY